jgi:hypothetical protein
LTELFSGLTVLLLFGLIQKEAKRSRTSNRPARMASAPPWMFGPTHVGMLSVVGKSVGSVLFWFGMTGAFLTERLCLGTVLLLFGLIQKEAKRSRTSNRPARMASAPPWMFGPTHVGMWSVVGGERWFLVFLDSFPVHFCLPGLFCKRSFCPLGDNLLVENQST